MASAEDGGRRFVVRPVSVIATGLAAAGAAFLTSRFGVAGTILGTAVMAMLISAGSSILEVYLETAAAKARTVPSGLRLRATPGNASPRAADTNHRGPGGFFARFASLPAARRRSVLVGTVLAAVLSFLFAMGAVTGVELSVGKSLSCWLWDECPKQSSSGGRPASETKTQPTIVGGQRINGSDQGEDHAPQVQPADHEPTLPGPPQAPQQQPGNGPNADGERTVLQAPDQKARGEPVETRPGSPSKDLDRGGASAIPQRKHPRPVPKNGSAAPQEVRSAEPGD
jgi:hypothetical protein